MWLELAFPGPDLPVPASGALPAGALHDDFDPPALRPRHLFRADAEVLRQTLVRLPSVRSPWLRDILENLLHHMRAGVF
ncbi:hypothetical protein ACKI1J_45805 [Streptomyces scabiei]|uniref:hypothetical protein n=1 Tax=Streptomyces scabiei TaxID=1930 RepID=UPI0039EFDCA8